MSGKPGEETPYEISLSLNVLNHLGLNLYSNTPAVLSEVVANSWDADAEKVEIEIDQPNGTVVVTDDGHGMTRKDVNAKYLLVGYDRRKDPVEAISPKFKRPVMGRKGIGKLSLFSIANVVELQTVKDGEPSAFRMVLQDIQEKIEASGGSAVYFPEPVDPSVVDLDQGTRLILSDLKKQLYATESALRRRLARRFLVLGSEFNFVVSINGDPLSIEDRDYYKKIQYVWLLGEESRDIEDRFTSAEEKTTRDDSLEGGLTVSGWIGTVAKSTDLKEESESINKVVIMVRGKLAQEDILDEFGEGGIYTKYVIGEVEADFLDVDDKEDIATSSRQKIIEDDPRYVALRKFLLGELKNVERSWSESRRKRGTAKALEIQAIKEWFETLDTDQKRSAESLFGKINELSIDNEAVRRRLFSQAVLAFESLRFKRRLEDLDQVSPENLEAVVQVIGTLDDIEGTLYHQITSERVAVIKKLREHVEKAALEKVVQQHLFDHLWLLDPSWERATDSQYMEESMAKALEDADKVLTQEEKDSRIDVRYQKTSGLHVIVELKKPDRIVSTAELLSQGDKYRTALRKVLESANRSDEPVEVVFLVGKPLKDWRDPIARKESAESLEPKRMRVVMYQELLENAYKAYGAYLEKSKEVGRIQKLIQELEIDDSTED